MFSHNTTLLSSSLAGVVHFVLETGWRVLAFQISAAQIKSRFAPLGGVLAKQKKPK